MDSCPDDAGGVTGFLVRVFPCARNLLAVARYPFMVFPFRLRLQKGEDEKIGHSLVQLLFDSSSITVSEQKLVECCAKREEFRKGQPSA